MSWKAINRLKKKGKSKKAINGFNLALRGLNQDKKKVAERENFFNG